MERQAAAPVIPDVTVPHAAPEDGPDRPESIRPALPGVECRVIDPDTGADLGTGQPGELLVRAASVMSGYRNDPEATSETVGRRLGAHRRHRHRRR